MQIAAKIGLEAGYSGLPPVRLSGGATLLVLLMAVAARAQDPGTSPLGAVESAPASGAVEVEPNDRIRTANPFDPAVVLTGDLDVQGSDYFRFQLDDGEQVRDISVELDAQTQVDLCLFDTAGVRIKCTRGLSTQFEAFRLNGEYVLSVSPVAVLKSPIPYRLKAGPPRSPQAGHEVEPNDRWEDAFPLSSAREVSGTVPGSDMDSFRLHVEGEPQIWQIEAKGEAVSWLHLTSGGGIDLQTRTGATGVVRMDNLLLRAGDYVVQLRSGVNVEQWAYTLRATPLGPPDKVSVSRIVTDPGASKPRGQIEEEPNEVEAQAQRLRFNEPRIGLLATSDVDVYRFYLPGHGRVRITAVPPSGGNVRLSFDSGAIAVGESVDQPTVFEGDLLAGDHYLSVQASTPGNGLYQLTMTQLDPLKGDSALGDVALTLVGETEPLAAYWPMGQRVKLRMSVGNESASAKDLEVVTASSAYAWQPRPDQKTLSLAPGQSKRVAVNVDVLADARADDPVLISVGVRDSNGTIASQSLTLTADCVAPPVNPRQIWPLPETLLGRINVASPGLGAKLLTEGRYFEQGFDGTVSRNTGLFTTLDNSVRVDLAGDAPVTLLGTLIHPAGSNASGRKAQLKGFEILTSMDGNTFTTAFEGVLTSDAEEQGFVFDTPVTARFAELRLKSNYAMPGYVGFGEWKLIAQESAATITGAPLNIADHEIGGHDVYSDPFTGGNCCHETFSTAGADGQYSTHDQSYEWVMGFRDNRAARITGFGWIDFAKRQYHNRDLPAVSVAISMGGPLGPWQPLGDWTLKRSETSVAPWQLEEPVWARFVKFSAPPLEGKIANTPQQIRIIEQDADETYRSVIGEWGYTNSNAIYEYLNRPAFAATAPEADGDDDDRGQATPLRPEQSVSGRVLVGEDVDWYAIDVPAEANQVRFVLRGDPSIDYAFEVQDANGTVLETRQRETDDGLELTVHAGSGRYYLKLFEPLRSIIFAWDTSGSVGPYYDVIDQTMKTFAGGVRTGREEVNLLPFSDGALEFLLDDWSGDSASVTTAVVNSDRKFNSSNAEDALRHATMELKKREGTRAVLFITDAESDGYDLTASLWQWLKQVRPRVFSFEISSKGTQVAQHMMQSYADVNQGFYDHALTAGDLQVGFDRAICMLRRPKTYHAVAHLDAVEPKPPGTLIVTLEKAEVAADDAVEVILDASGSMYQKLDGRFRYQIAKEVLDDLVATTLPGNIGFALRVFGNRDASSCRSDLEVPLEPLDRAAARSVIEGIEPQPYAYTPIADSLAKVAKDLEKVSGRKTVVLVTDGQESCDGDVEAVIAKLKAGGIDVQLNVIGFDFDADDKEVAREQFRRWAKLGDGHYFDANNAQELAQSLTQAVSAPAPFDVLNANGDVVASGVANGEAVEVPQGRYKLRVAGSSPQVVDKVLVNSKQETEISLTSQ